MAEVILNTKCQQRNDTAVNWVLVNPILLRGELGIELDTGKIKIGNGSTPWINLPYLGMGLTQNDILNFVYPIGSIKMSTDNVNPSDVIGGVWTRWGNGRVPISVDDNQEEFRLSENVGGEKEHTLTIDEIPAHNHNVATEINGTRTISNILQQVEVPRYEERMIQTSLTGGGEAHNNLPPYITCYFWKRTA